MRVDGPFRLQAYGASPVRWYPTGASVATGKVEQRLSRLWGLGLEGGYLSTCWREGVEWWE